MNQLQALYYKLLRIPLFYKILLANLAVVVMGAVVGTVITVWHVLRYPDDLHYELIALFAVSGVIISAIVNNLVLKLALRPLDDLQSAVDEVRQGNLNVQVTPDALVDERFERLFATFNQMVATLEADAQQLHRLSRLILQAQEDERQRVARELHDEAAQALTSLLVHLRLLERAHNPEDAQRRVEELRQLTAQALEEVRRVALDLRPKILDDLGLEAALGWRTDELNDGGLIQAELKVTGVKQRIPHELELVLYRVAQEALNNVARHAQATQATIALRQGPDWLTLEVRDDGIGFDPQQPDLGRSPDRPGGLGLMGMQERLAMVGGTLTIESRPHIGTQVLARVPMKPLSVNGAFGNGQH